MRVNRLTNFKILTFFLFIAVQSAVAQSYFVDGVAGSDNGSGQILSPWKTIQKAASSIQGGGTVYIRGGVYHENVDIQHSGTPSNPLIFRNYGSELVIIDGTGTSQTIGSALIRVEGKSNLQFKNLTLRNLICQEAAGLKIVNSNAGPMSNTTASNLTIYNIKWTASDWEDPEETDNAYPLSVYGAGATAAKAISNVTIEGCTIFNNITGFSESLAISGNVDGFIIRNNTVRDNSNIGIDIVGNYGASPNPNLDQPRNGVIRANKTYNHSSSYAAAAGIYIDGGRNISVENNESYNNSYGIEIGCEPDGTTEDIVVKNNIAYNNIVCGIHIGGYNSDTSGVVVNCIVRNNTVFANDTEHDGNGEIQISKAIDCRIENNVFYTNAQHILMSYVDIQPQYGNTFDYNCWFTPNNNSEALGFFYPEMMYTDFSEYQSKTGQDEHSFYGNPMILAGVLSQPNLGLQAASPCINAGNPATEIAPDETEFTGMNRALGAIDIGAYEFLLPLDVQENLFADFTISPVPARESLTVNSNLEISEAHIYDLSGKLLETFQNPEAGSISLGNIAGGLYILKVDFADGTSGVRKFVKL